MNLLTRFLAWFRPAVLPRTAPRPAAPARVGGRQRAGAALAAGAAVFVGLQLGLGIAAELSLFVKDPGYADKEVRLARQEAANAGGPVVVMLGTSRTGYAFHAGRVRGELLPELGGPVTVFNFGIPASGPVTHLVYTRRLLVAGHRPDLLLIEVLPPSLDDLRGGPLESRFMYGDRLRRGEVDVVIGYDFPAQEVRRKWWGSVVTPWYTLRFPLLGRAFPSALPWHLRFDWSRAADEYGWSAALADTVTPEQYREGLERAKGEYRGILAGLRPTGGAARALGDLLTLCREQGIPVRLVLMPESVGFRALYPPPATARLYAFLRRVCAEHGCELVDAREWLPDSAFIDGHHMLRTGAEAFSDRLTREVILPFLRSRAGR